MTLAIFILIALGVIIFIVANFYAIKDVITYTCSPNDWTVIVFIIDVILFIIGVLYFFEWANTIKLW